MISILEKIKPFLAKHWYFFHIVKYHTYRLNPIRDQQISFFNVHNRILNLENPKYYNDQIIWLKLFWRDELAKICANKFTARQYIENTVGKKYLAPLINVFDKPNEIDFDILPNRYVVKMSHGSGMNIIINDSSQIDRINILKKLRKWKKIEYYYLAREWVYHKTPRKVLIEKNLLNEANSSLVDYKFFCFNGRARVYYTSNKTYNNHGDVSKRRTWYSIEGEEISFLGDKLVFSLPKIQNNYILKMIELSSKLSNPFPHCRIDFYFIDDQIIISEMTFFHSAGFEKFPSLAFEEYLGQFLSFKGGIYECFDAD